MNSIRRLFITTLIIPFIITLLLQMFLSYKIVETITYKRIENSVEGVAKIVNTWGYEKWTKHRSYCCEYQDISDKLHQFRQVLNARFVYTMAGNGGDMIVQIDGALKEEALQSEIGEVDSTITMKDAYDVLHGKTQNFGVQHDEKYGDITVIWTPIFNDNHEIIGILGADIEVESIKRETMQILLDNFLWFFGAFFISFILILPLYNIVIRLLIRKGE